MNYEEVNEDENRLDNRENNEETDSLKVIMWCWAFLMIVIFLGVRYILEQFDIISSHT